MPPNHSRPYLQFLDKGGASICEHPPDAVVEDHVVHICEFKGHQLEGQQRKVSGAEALFGRSH